MEIVLAALVAAGVAGGVVLLSRRTSHLPTAHAAAAHTGELDRTTWTAELIGSTAATR